MRRRTAFTVAAGVIIGGILLSSILLQRGSSERPRLSVRLGEDKCRRCGMIVSRLEFAAAILLEGERRWYVYDDVGCFAKDYNEFTGKGRKVELAKVFDYKTKEELDAASAYYVLADSKNLWTPMSYGVVALGRKDEAEELATRMGGAVKDFTSMLGVFK